MPKYRLAAPGLMYFCFHGMPYSLSCVLGVMARLDANVMGTLAKVHTPEIRMYSRRAELREDRLKQVLVPRPATGSHNPLSNTNNGSPVREETGESFPRHPRHFPSHSVIPGAAGNFPFWTFIAGAESCA